MLQEGSRHDFHPLPPHQTQGPTKLDLAGRGLTSLKPEALAVLAPSLRWLDLSRNPTLHPGPDHSPLLPALRALPNLESLRVDVAASEGDDEEEEERLARALPSLRWINGRYITRAGGRVLLDDGDAQEQGGQQRQTTRRRQEIVDKVLMGVWARAEPMRLGGPTARHHAELHWCVLDLPGLALGHGSSSDSSDSAERAAGEPPQNNVAVLHMRDRALGVTFSAAWPVRRLARGQPVTRDYLEGFPRPLPCDPARLLTHLHGADGGGLPGKSSLAAAEAEARENVEEGQQQQEPPPAAEPVFPIDGAAARPLRVFTDMPVLRENLGLPHLFGFTDDVEGAFLCVFWGWSVLCDGSHNPPLAHIRRRRHRLDRGRTTTIALHLPAAAAAMAQHPPEPERRGRQVRHGLAPAARGSAGVAAPDVLPAGRAAGAAGALGGER